MAVKFFKCEHCGNVIQKVVDSKVPVVCCGEKMKELTVNTVDASVEKHLPVVTRLNDCPMTEDHHIAFIYVEMENGGIRIDLPHEGKAEAEICTCSGKPVAVYEYCNLHGVWKTEL